MGTAEGTLPSPPFSALRTQPKGKKFSLTALLRKYHILKPEPTLEQRRDALIKKAIKCASSMHLDDALKHLGEAIYSCGISSEVLLLKGMVYMDKGDMQFAAQAFRASIETLKVIKEDGNATLGTFIEEYMYMRQNHPAPKVRPVCYIPVQQAFIDASVGAFGQTDKNIAYALHFASGGLQ
jgi:hypothetical protein